jgi:hypothetical protein
MTVLCILPFYNTVCPRICYDNTATTIFYKLNETVLNESKKLDLSTSPINTEPVLGKI